MMLRLAVLTLAALGARGATTTYWEMNSFGEFSKGRIEGLSLTRDGRLKLAPRADTVFTSDQPVIWSVARGPGGSYYVATGHRGQVYLADGAGKSELIWKAPEPEVFALAAAPNGVLYAATSPNGKVYRIENGKATEYFAPQAKFIWSLALAADGALYAGTGDDGKIFRITAAGKGEVWYETGQAHVTCLALDGEGRLLAGSEPNGILFRVTAKDKAFVLYDANLPEIRAIVPGRDGSLYVAALGGAFGKKQAGAQAGVAAANTAVVAAQPTTITVTDASAQAGVEIKPGTEAQKTTATTTAVTTSLSPVLDLTGVDRSALYRIAPDNLVETLWVSKEENIYDLAPSGNEILFSTDTQGRVYRLEADRKPTLLIETREGEATRLMQVPNAILAATSHAGKLLRIGIEPGGAGEYESPVHDAGAAARWGRLVFRGETPANSKLAFRTRSGNSARPDKTWSEWSAPVTVSGTAVTSPNARYIQWKGEFTGSQGATPQLENVSVAYLPMNTPPVVRSIQVSAQATATAAKPVQAQAAVSYSVTVTDGPEAAAGSQGNPTQTVTRPSSGQLVITWQAEDSDGDKLSYTVLFRGEDQHEWKQLKTNITELAMIVDGDALADGKYLFRVVASDALSNPPSTAREADLVSAPVLIDNTPPVVVAGAPAGAAGALEIAVEATDAASPIRALEYSVNAGSWVPAAPVDGVADSPRESYLLRLAGLPAGENLLVIRAHDAGGNTGLARLVLR